MADKCDVSLVLACYNEAEHFSKSVPRIIEVLDQTDFSWEIIFVDDASNDKTSLMIKNIIKKYPRKQLSAYYHEKNQGRGASVSEGTEKAQGRTIRVSFS